MSTKDQLPKVEIETNSQGSDKPENIWDESPRAVIPGEELVSSEVPILGTTEHAKCSPLPYGVAVLVKGKQLPLYYISPKVAQLRGRGVRPGWYIVAQLGCPFQLRVTNVYSKEMNNLPPGHASVVEIFVDGNNIFGAADENLLASPGSEETFHGFTVGITYKDGSIHGHESVRQFRFSKAMGENGKGDNAAEVHNSGVIELRIFQGPTKNSDLFEAERSFNVNKPCTVDEKQAVKEGRSVRVDYAGTTMDLPVARAESDVQHDGVPVGTVSLFLREHYWMESRCLIDTKGNAWKPSTSDKPIDLTDEMDEGTTNPPESKKAKLEVVDLTLVRDTIDLTKDVDVPVNGNVGRTD